MGAWDDESIGVDIPYYSNAVAPDFPLAEGQPTMFDVGGYYNPVPSGAPTTSGFNWGSIFRGVTDVVSPFAKSFNAALGSALGTKVNQAILGTGSPALTAGQRFSGSPYALPSGTRVPGYAAGVVSGGGNPYPILSEGGAFSPVWLLVAVGAFLAVMVLRK
jgi:hypothetical protein